MPRTGSVVTFKPSIASIALTLALLALFLGLGRWQLQRAESKQQRIELHASAPQQTGLPNPDEALEFTRVTLEGSFDPARHILADNKVLSGRAGVHAYTPFMLLSSETVLVNRGWLPLPADRSLPPVPTTEGVIRISGRLGPITGTGRQLGQTDSVSERQWPQLLTYPDLDRISPALGVQLYPLVLFLDHDSPGGFEGRDWQPVFMSPARHRAYAFQWFALAAATIAGWFLLGLRKRRAT